MLFGRGAGSVDHRAALVHEALALLKCLLLFEQSSCELLDLVSLLRRPRPIAGSASARRTARARSGPTPGAPPRGSRRRARWLTSATPSEFEQLERKPYPLGRVLDTREHVGDVTEQILAPTEIAALVAQRDAHLGESVLRLAGALRGLRRTPREALQRHVERLLLDAGRLRGEPQLLQNLDADPDLVRGLVRDGRPMNLKPIPQRYLYNSITQSPLTSSTRKTT